MFQNFKREQQLKIGLKKLNQLSPFYFFSEFFLKMSEKSVQMTLWTGDNLTFSFFECFLLLSNFVWRKKSSKRTRNNFFESCPGNRRFFRLFCFCFLIKCVSHETFRNTVRFLETRTLHSLLFWFKKSTKLKTIIAND